MEISIPSVFKHLTYDFWISMGIFMCNNFNCTLYNSLHGFDTVLTSHSLELSTKVPLSQMALPLTAMGLGIAFGALATYITKKKKAVAAVTTDALQTSGNAADVLPNPSTEPSTEPSTKCSVWSNGPPDIK